MKTGREIKDELLEGVQDLVDDAEYYTAGEFAAKYGYKEATIRQMIHRGQITRAVKVHGMWMVHEEAEILVSQYTKKNKYIL